MDYLAENGDLPLAQAAHEAGVDLDDLSKLVRLTKKFLYRTSKKRQFEITF
jgi:hypothetical protein